MKVNANPYYYFVCVSGSPDRSTHDGELHFNILVFSSAVAPGSGAFQMPTRRRRRQL